MGTEKQLNVRFAKFSLKLFHETHFFFYKNGSNKKLEEMEPNFSLIS